MLVFYSIVRFIVRLLVLLLNGKPDVQEKQNLPDNENYIIIAPHRSWIDPVFLVVAAAPKQFSFMAKKELFEYPVFGWLIRKMNAFPVDRHNPGPSAIKTPVKILKDSDLGVVIFPTGTRHSTELKGGAVTIAKMSKKPIVPAVYKGPYTFKSLLKREKASVRFGKPFTVERRLDGVKDINAHYSNLIQSEFDRLDSEI